MHLTPSREYIRRLQICIQDDETLRDMESMNQLLRENVGLGVLTGYQQSKRRPGVPLMDTGNAIREIRLQDRERNSGIRVIQRSRTLRPKGKCSPDCKCSCHNPSKLTVGRMFNRSFKKLFPWVAGDPFFVQKCNLLDCRATEVLHRQVLVVVHAAFVCRAIVLAARSRGLRIKIEIESYIIVPETSEIITAAQTGNLDVIRKNIRKHGALVNATSEDGWSLLHVSGETEAVNYD
jgi:hypothetical protein